MTTRSRAGTLRVWGGSGLLTLAMTASLAGLSVAGGAVAAPRAASSVPGPAVPAVHTLADAVPGLADLDARGSVAPSAAARSAATSLGAASLRWNQFGTPSSILPANGSLGSGYSTDPAQAPAAARSWLRDHAAVFGLTAGAIDKLELVNNAELADSDARAVLFRQKFGKLTPSLDSMVTVGVARGSIAYVSSSLAPTTKTPPAAVLSPLQGWLAAATNVGRTVSAADQAQITTTVESAADGGWTRIAVPGYTQPQLARTRSLALADGSVRPVIEANVVDVKGGSTFAYTLMMDAVTGAVLHRQNQVDNSTDAFQFQGAITATDCGPRHGFELTDANTQTITAVATEVNTVNDIVLNLYDPQGTKLASSDTATSPEVVTYSAASIPAGIYSVEVCPFLDPTAPVLPPYNYSVAVTTSDAGVPGTPGTGAAAVNPKWRFFRADPSLDSLDKNVTPTNSTIACWFAPVDRDCDFKLGALENVQAAGPWDTIAGTGVGTGTTVGNNASTHEAWASPLTPGGTEQAPVSATRSYTAEFQDLWNNSQCDPTQLVPATPATVAVGKGNDILPSVTDLFATHNFMHDYSYYLGFTERNYNLQLSNLGRGGTQGDPEVGNAQAGAVDGGAPTYEGRDNANQIALQDGVPGITNQYLFQPIAGAFYAPCTDGALDFGIVGHEYTHAISNRMVGGPDEGLTSEQGGAMGESWSDLNAAEYQFNHGYDNGGNVWAVGVYATQNPTRAIRDYSIDANPLNYSDYGFDTTGPEVHADGEIWNGTQWSVRQALVDKYKSTYKYTDKKLQLACATANATQSPRDASLCPGNRRWIQLIFDAFLLQQGGTSMLDARDAMLAADTMRFDGADTSVMWQAFAQRGMGAGADAASGDDTDPTPAFDAPAGQGTTTTVTLAPGTPGQGRLYIGDFEARANPIADLDPSTALGSSTRMVPGVYDALYVSPTTGFTRFGFRVPATGSLVVKPKAFTNLAAAANGASVMDSSADSRNPGALIDGTESTNWGGLGAAIPLDPTNPTAPANANVDDSDPHPSVTVDLAGNTPQLIQRIQVSAYLNPATDSDADSGSRFTALRSFAFEFCNSDCASANAVWSRIYVSPDDAFPATLPRPVAPDLTMRTFRLRSSHRAEAVRLIALENQCTGNAEYAGDQDTDPTNPTDCKTGSDRGTIVHAAELQVFSR